MSNSHFIITAFQQYQADRNINDLTNSLKQILTNPPTKDDQRVFFDYLNYYHSAPIYKMAKELHIDAPQWFEASRK
jgi:hypothetical protein